MQRRRVLRGRTFLDATIYSEARPQRASKKSIFLWNACKDSDYSINWRAHSGNIAPLTGFPHFLCVETEGTKLKFVTSPDEPLINWKKKNKTKIKNIPWWHVAFFASSLNARIIVGINKQILKTFVDFFFSAAASWKTHDFQKLCL